jgi:hypothetical protein
MENDKLEPLKKKLAELNKLIVKTKTRMGNIYSEAEITLKQHPEIVQDQEKLQEVTKIFDELFDARYDYWTEMNDIVAEIDTIIANLERQY